MTSTKKNAKILLIDDDEFLLDSMKQMLDFEYSDVIAVGSAEKGIEILKTNKFDLCVTDYKMGGMNGADFVKQIRKAGNETPVILISGVLEGPDIKEAMGLGASRFLAKPFEILTFLDLVEVQLKK